MKRELTCAFLFGEASYLGILPIRKLVDPHSTESSGLRLACVPGGSVSLFRNYPVSFAVFFLQRSGTDTSLPVWAPLVRGGYEKGSKAESMFYSAIKYYLHPRSRERSTLLPRAPKV
jgi:hypothetical protein